MTKLIQNIKVRDQIYNLSLLLLCKKHGSMSSDLLSRCQDCRGANSITFLKKIKRISFIRIIVYSHIKKKDYCVL